ncbi:MAG: hypothetical protein PHD06_08555 [Bacteroidales bacterium]|jgi:hypothetical protein|nr:hypothetical protein [Bacteroidales bacterium]MDD4385213.1 hypothetical protein [Bacteroidales bacterium]MDY0198218.1 hypothetical protein [Tenuifilaceae bacterium]
MASVRNIKKDIDFLVGEVVSDCYTYLYLHGDKNRDKVIEIIEGIVGKRNDFIERVNNPEKDADTKQKRKHFKQIYSDLLGTVDESFSKLSTLVS